MSLKITNISRVKQQILEEASKAIYHLDRREFEADLPPKISTLFLKYLRRSSVLLGLTGFYPGDELRDLQAIFGLSDDLAQEAASEIIGIVETSIRTKFTVSLQKKRLRFSLRFYYEDLEAAIRSIPSAQYTYTYKEATFVGGRSSINTGTLNIPWLQWLLDGASTEASLEFDLDSSELRPARSGRALMIRSGGGWDWIGVNFIEEIVSDPSFITDLENLVERQLTVYIKDRLS